MTRTAQQIIAISICILMSMLACLIPFRFAWKEAAKAEMREEIRKGLAASTTQLIPATSLSDADWENGSEFRHGDKLYDVASTEYYNGKKYYRCIADIREAAAEHEADNLTSLLLGQKGADKSGKLVNAFVDWLSGLYCEPIPTWPTSFTAVIQTRHFAALVCVPAKPSLRRDAIPPEV